MCEREKTSHLTKNTTSNNHHNIAASAKLHDLSQGYNYTPGHQHVAFRRGILEAPGLGDKTLHQTTHNIPIGSFCGEDEIGEARFNFISQTNLLVAGVWRWSCLFMSPVRLTYAHLAHLDGLFPISYRGRPCPSPPLVSV